MSPEGSKLLFDHCPTNLDRPRLRRFLRRLSLEVTPEGYFHCLLTRDARLRRLNAQFLGRDAPTDVLSFSSEAGGGFLGEIAISVDRAQEQAAGCGHRTEDEIEILMLHGVLHLKGMDHHGDGGRMARAERFWRRKLGLAGNLLSRSRARP